MKAIIVRFAFFVFATTLLISCEQSYICQCSKTYTRDDGNVTINDHATYTYKDNRVRAEQRCDNNTATGSDLGGDYTVNCAIQ
ncbi:MAG: hypothetical protein K0R65_117 [Crocinitomicaceae bacterium]|jgi:hypothetical protein|nr:hypothetical protein [Crocinitomicaceae bacterium]